MASKRKKMLIILREIDAKAADYVEKKAKELKHYNSQGDNLGELFIWEETPQGHDYWSKLAMKVAEKRDSIRGKE